MAATDGINNNPSLKIIKEAGWFVHYAAGQVLIHVRAYTRMPKDGRMGLTIEEAMATRLYPMQLAVARHFLKELMDLSNRPIPEIEVQAKDVDAKLVAAETVHAQLTTRVLLAQFSREELDLLGVPPCFQQTPELKIKL